MLYREKYLRKRQKNYNQGQKYQLMLVARYYNTNTN